MAEEELTTNTTTTTEEQTTQEDPLEKMTLKELQDILTNEFEFVGADKFTTKDQVRVIIRTLRDKKEKEEAATQALLDEMDKLEQKKVVVTGEDGKKVTLIENPTAPTPEDRAAERTDKKRWEGKAAAMKAHLAAQPKVQFLIPLGFGEKRGAYETVIMNGYRLNIMKGVLVQIPQQVATLLADSYQMTAEAGSDFLLDRADAVKESLQ